MEDMNDAYMYGDEGFGYIQDADILDRPDLFYGAPGGTFIIRLKAFKPQLGAAPKKGPSVCRFHPYSDRKSCLAQKPGESLAKAEDVGLNGGLYYQVTDLELAVGVSDYGDGLVVVDDELISEEFLSLTCGQSSSVVFPPLFLPSSELEKDLVVECSSLGSYLFTHVTLPREKKQQPYSLDDVEVTSVCDLELPQDELDDLTVLGTGVRVRPFQVPAFPRPPHIPSRWRTVLGGVAFLTACLHGLPEIQCVRSRGWCIGE